MEPNRKKRKLEKESQSKLTFLDLNDDCIFGILCKLPKIDLCSMSFTCKRLQDLLFNHYPRQYPDDGIVISISATEDPNDDKKIKLMDERFSKCIKNVRIESFGTHENMQDLIDFVDIKCCTSLQTLELNIAGLLKEVHVQSIKSRLQNLSTLFINEPHNRLDIYNALLKYCKNLEHLKLKLTSSFDTFWMMHTYPTIKTLTIGLMTEQSAKICNTFAKKFFQLNPQIKSIECFGAECNTEWKKFIEIVLLNVINIERLALIPVYRKTIIIIDWIPIIDQLIRYTKQNQIKWLHLRIGPQRKSETKVCEALANLNAVQPISELEYILAGLPNELTLMSQLKYVQKLTLKFSNYVIRDELFDVSSKQLPKLEHLELSVRGYDNLNFQQIAMKFIQNSFKVKKLTFTYCRSETFIFHPNDLFELNQRRSSLSCASPVVIQCKFLSGFVAPVFRFPLPVVKPFVSVNVKFTEIVFDEREVR